MGRLHAAIDTLLTNAQRAGAVRADVRVPEVVTMMIGVSRAAEHAGSDQKLLARVLTIIFDGLRPSGRVQ